MDNLGSNPRPGRQDFRWKMTFRAYAITVMALGSLLLPGVGIGRQQAQAAASFETCNLIFSNGVMLRAVPVARTEAQQNKGLSKWADVRNGMLFSWLVAEPRVFWMRDTYVPLTIGFFGDDGKLFAIEDMQPNTDTYHLSMQPARDALELPQGGFRDAGLAIGVQLLRRECNKAKSLQHHERGF